MRHFPGRGRRKILGNRWRSLLFRETQIDGASGRAGRRGEVRCEIYLLIGKTAAFSRRITRRKVKYLLVRNRTEEAGGLIKPESSKQEAVQGSKSTGPSHVCVKNPPLTGDVIQFRILKSVFSVSAGPTDESSLGGEPDSQRKTAGKEQLKSWQVVVRKRGTHHEPITLMFYIT